MIEGLRGPGARREEGQVHQGPDRLCIEAQRVGYQLNGAFRLPATNGAEGPEMGVPELTLRSSVYITSYCPDATLPSDVFVCR